ncbi:hypothetical protein BGZ99_004043 [Dissophora globulifera]|uniref:DUF1751-domain-containing protein n=1 Tax=Dissophora globulifera TaxID=979702 RepID=A0A9P6UVN0_9FUNG|nr:hypothetical protein BGZ99_004043 [Dissophora globulifera]
MSPTLPTSWKATFTNVPPLTKSLSTAITVMTALSFTLRLRDFLISYQKSQDTPYVDSESALIPLLALVPVSAPYRFWTFASASFYERNIIKYAISTTILLASGKYLERAWGSREFFKSLAVSSIGTMIGIYLTCVFEYVIRGNDELLYDTQAYGLTGVLAGFLIGFKQLVPEHLLTIGGVFSVRVKTLPLLFALLMVLEGLISHTQIQFLMSIYGLYISWLYSRFFRVQDGIRGDRSDTFSFASFFPEFIQPPVKALSNMCFGILVRLNVCSPTGYGGSFQYDLENPQMSGMGHTFTQPGSLRAEAERRRALALKALDMRLHAAATLAGSGRSGGLSRSGGSSTAGPVSLLSLSAEPLRRGADDDDSDDDDKVLFKTTELDDEEVKPSDPSLPLVSSNTESTKSEKEKQ